MNPEQAFKAYEHLKGLQSVTRGVDLELARELSLLKKDENYKIIMGDQEATWKAFLAQPELKIHVAKADRLVKIYDTYIIKLELTEEDIQGIDSNSLNRLSTVVTKENVEEWLDKARELSRADLLREIKFGDINEMECEHNYKCKKICVCSVCGTREVEKV